METKAYLAAAADAGISEEEREAIVSIVASDPNHGTKPSGWGGARKFRFARARRGKSGSFRVVSANCGPNAPVFLITVFGKGEKDNLTRSEANALAKLMQQLCSGYGT